MILSKWTENANYNLYSCNLADEIYKSVGDRVGDSVKNFMPEWSGMIGGWSIDRNFFSSVPLDGTDASDRRKTQAFYGISIFLLALSFHDWDMTGNGF